MIRAYRSVDYDQVSELIRENKLSVPTEPELCSHGLVWEEDEKIVGFVWGLTNEHCATVFVDYFVVAESFRKGRDPFGRGRIAVRLITELLGLMHSLGKTRVIGQLPKVSLSESLARIYNAVGMKFYQPYQFVEGNIQEILTRMKEGQHGKLNGTENNHTPSNA